MSHRHIDGAVEENRAWGTADISELSQAAPWRTFRWHRGQRHYSGTYWAATVSDHVIYESRLELARLLLADFDPSVRHIAAQPFLVKALVQGKLRKHIPDYLLMTQEGPLIADVKPKRRLDKPEVAFTFAWTRQVVQGCGWRYQVWSEPAPTPLENVRFLAGYRREWLFPGDLLDAVAPNVVDGMTLGEAADRVAGFVPELARAGVFHLLWSGRLMTDLQRPLSASHVLRRAA
ncbi:TnsA-like heteromeric transposase endonuclease subunit [Streptomyces sp. NPDC018972]|uniref:TnsA-like heteromeric transposase endonuclease subunit n=1 Tax=Streptomyces sp. NPDC018972 TaxID=3365060 RepID=UPI0037A3E04A